jgi:hypothetical protein
MPLIPDLSDVYQSPEFQPWIGLSAMITSASTNQQNKTKVSPYFHDSIGHNGVGRTGFAKVLRAKYQDIEVGFDFEPKSWRYCIHGAFV